MQHEKILEKERQNKGTEGIHAHCQVTIEDTQLIEGI